MQSDIARDYLLARQRAERMTAREMARRIGITEANWCHVRKGRRALAPVQILRACTAYPELLDSLFAEEKAS